jgi:diguanylate cyclase (GGDEF)-like protein
MGSACVALVGTADYLTTYELSLAIVYLAPIMAASWYAGRTVGLLLSLASATIAVVTDLWSGQQYSSVLFHVWDGVMRMGFFGTAAVLLDALHRALSRERALARRDALTGLANRVCFFEVAEAELARARRHARPLTVAYVDCDHFKAVNDTRGHDEGDRVLEAVGEALAGTIRKTDLAARIGGDEFALLFPELDAAQAREVVLKVKARLDAAMRQGGWPITFSVGVVSCASVPESVDVLLRRADELMYEVKTGGRDALRFAEISGAAPSPVELRRAGPG